MVDRQNSSHEPPAMAVNLSRMQMWMPSPVHALATNPDGKVVAVGREDGDIELTVPSEGYRVEARIPGHKGKGLRSLVWLEGKGDSEPQGDGVEPARLFGCGLDGTVFEADLVRLCYKNVRDAYGGSAWCMRAASELALLAVGCEDGSVRLFSTDGDGVEYKRSLPSTGSRVLSLAWGPGNDTIFAGCADSLIHCVDAASGQGLFDMRLESGRREEALVWALEALSDGTIVSGDSYGRVQVWDGLTGTQLQSLATHEADVLCLCVAEGQTELFASGCDGKVVSLERRQAPISAAAPNGDAVVDMDYDAGGNTPSTGRRTRQEWEWTVGGMRREHTHDVHALAIHEQTLEGQWREGDGGMGAARKGPVLMSAGVDASLSLYSVPGFQTQGPRSVEPLPPIPVAFLARAPRLVLVMHNLHLDLWEIPRPAKSFAKGLGDAEENGTSLDDGEGGKLPELRLRMEPKTQNGGHMACAALSAAGDLVAVSNAKETKVYRLANVSSPGKPTTPKRLRLPGACAPPANALAFTPDGRRLIVAATAGDIRVVDLDVEHEADVGGSGMEAGAQLVHCFEEHVDGVRPGGDDEGALPVSAVTLSASGKWLASSSVSGVVHVFDLMGLRHHWMVPSFSSHRVVGMRFHCRDDILVCVDTSNAFRLIDVQQRRLAACHENVKFPLAPSGKGAWGGGGDVQPLSGIAFNPDDPLHSMLLSNHRSVMYVTPRRKIPANVVVIPRKNKRPRLSEGGKADKANAAAKAATNQSNFRMIRDFSSVVLLDFLGENELLVLENPWESVKESLPDVIDRKQYGV